MKNDIVLGDCLVEMDKMEDNSVDLAVVDPPYGAGYDFDNDDLDGKDFVAFSQTWVEKLSRKLKESGSAYVFINKKRLWTFQMILDQYLHFRNIVVWNFEAFFNGFHRNFDNRCEFVLFYTKNTKDWYTFNIIKEPPSASLIKRWGPYADASGNIPFESLTPSMQARQSKENYDRNPTNVKRGAYLGNVIFCNRVRNRVHPTQKPEDLIEKFIMASSTEGDLVFDPFSGSGTTCAVAKRLKRSYLGIEINEEFHAISVKRLESIKVERDLKQFVKDKKRDDSLLKFVKT